MNLYLTRVRCQSADERIKEYKDHYETAIEDVQPEAPRVRVAILDTGLDLGPPLIRGNVDRIVEVKSWLPPRDGQTANGTDTTGHGTHVTGLLLTTAPDCDVYVAQIADENGLISPGQIAKVSLIRQPYDR